MLQVPKYSAHVLDEYYRAEGYYYLENGYWMNNGVPEFDKPVQRHKIVDENGFHHDIAPETLEQL